MIKLLDNMPNFIRWFQTLVTPIILGLFFGGIMYLIVPNAIGQKISFGLVATGIILGIFIVAIRILTKKGPAYFYNPKKS